MSKNVLVIGTYLDKGVDSYDWWQQLPNISEYDTIILDTTRILRYVESLGRLEHIKENLYAVDDENEIYKQISTNLDLVRKKLLEKLEFESTIYALYLPKSIINYHPVHYDGSGKGYLGSISTNEWCPVSIKIVQETGKFINVKDVSYQDYFTGFSGWQYYFDSDSLEITDINSHYHDKWIVWAKIHPIAINKVEKPIAIEVGFLFNRQHTPQRIGSRLVLLPVANQYDTKSCIEIILQRGKQFEATPPPNWINTIEIPGETSLKKDIENKKQQLRTIESELKESERSLAEFTKYKGILYETGSPLQELVKSALRKIGANVKPSIVTDEFIVEVNGYEALIEVKGNVKSVTKDDVAQLVADLMEHLKTTGQEINGILIGNGWRLEPPEQRDIGSKTIFSRDAIRVAQNHNIALFSTTELFKAYCQTLEYSTRKEEILNKIISSKGIIKF
jgi:hypothetical protein